MCRGLVCLQKLLSLLSHRWVLQPWPRLSLLWFPRHSPSSFHHRLHQGRVSCSMPILLLHKLQARAGWEAKIPFRGKKKKIPEVWKLVFIIVLRKKRAVDDYKPEREPLALFSLAARGPGRAWHCGVRALQPVHISSRCRTWVRSQTIPGLSPDSFCYGPHKSSLLKRCPT